MLGSAAAVVLLSGCAPSGDGSEFDSGDPLDPPEGFSGRELPIPPLLEPGVDGRCTLRVQHGETEIVSGLTTATWGFNGAILGPTLRASRGKRVRVHVDNTLDELTTVHWHGMILPANMDGGPHQPIVAGGSWEPEWIIDQPAATLWYHPHPHGSTAEQVYRSLAGLFIIDDPDAPDGLPSEYGVDDVPLILQDRSLNTDGSLSDNSVPHYGLLGDLMTVNGAHAATFTATRTTVRFRILNGANARRFNLAFSDDREFFVVGTDAGLLPVPVPVRKASISPGERIEIVVTLSAGDAVTLQTRSGSQDIDQGNLDILQIVATIDASAGALIPAALPGPGAIRPPQNATKRSFELNGTDEINGREMSMARIDTVVPRGAIEVWSVTNDSDYAHNFHIHGSAFTILTYEGAAPAAWMAGHKDTVFVPPHTTARLAVKFADYVDEDTPYMYHCHLLRHEDKGMMAQFLIVDPDRVQEVPTMLDSGGHSQH